MPNKDKTTQTQAELSTLLNQQLTNKERENRQLYKLVHTLKERVTNLELETTNQAVTIEDLQAVINQNAKGQGAPAEEPEFIENEE